jgi:uncharacterized membrane protein (Fun14 family)
MTNMQYGPGLRISGPISYVIRRFVTDLFYMPRWHKGVLAIALLSTGLGWSHWGYHVMADVNSSSTQPTQTVQQGPYAYSTNGNSSPANSPSGTAQSPIPGPSTVSSPSPLASWARRAGGSVLVGFVIGWAFRTFLRTMASITTIFVGALGLLSYFHIMNVDMTAAEQKYTTASSWVTDQAGKLRDAAISHVHSTAAGALGMIMGVRKKRMPHVPAEV